MKYFKHIQLFITASIIFSCVYPAVRRVIIIFRRAPPLDFRSYYDGLTVTFANAAEGATDISWDFGDVFR